MICWKCLAKMIPWMDDNNRQSDRCRCGNKPGPGNDQSRADRFMALVGKVTAGILANGDASLPTTPESIRTRANMILRDIESAVESGALFGEGEKP